jgi:hypothetical protein
MRTAIVVLCYGLSLGLGLIALALAAWGFYQDNQALTSAQGFATVGAFIAAARYVAAGAFVGVVALALAVAGGRARA